jgi:hypothetical protein
MAPRRRLPPNADIPYSFCRKTGPHAVIPPSTNVCAAHPNAIIRNKGFFKIIFSYSQIFSVSGFVDSTIDV